MNHNHQVYRHRRETLVERMRTHSGGGLALVPTAPEVARNRDSHYPYRHDSYFYYLSGFPEPEAVVALHTVDGDTKQILFCRQKNEEREIWDGFRYGPEQAREVFAMDEAHTVARLDELMPDLIADHSAVFCHLGADQSWDARVLQWIN